MKKIAFLTDIEGNLAFFQRYLGASRVLQGCLSGTAPNQQLSLDFKTDHSHFIFGGDCFDKGPGDLIIARALLGLKRRYPERVTLIVGNRDMNKMKLTSELSEEDINRGPDAVPTPYWLPPEKSYAGHLKYNRLQHGRVSKLKWLLKHTMGCPNTFEYRRQELGGNNITDEMVVDSFWDSVRPGGVVWEYLQECQVAALFDNNTLVVHGSVNHANMGFVPSFGDGVSHDFHHYSEVAGSTYNTARSWVNALNAYGSHGVEEWIRHPFWDSERKWRGGMGFMGYGYSKSIRDRTVVTTNFLRNGSPQFLHNNVDSFLRKNGIRRVLSGHQPYGDSPGIIAQPRKGPIVIFADTAYSDPTAPDFRGCAHAEVLLEGNETRIHGALSTGETYDFLVDPPADDTDEGSNNLLGIGKRHHEGWWGKAVLPGNILLSSRSKSGGFEVEYRRDPL